jgi:hypothetical protein
MEPVFPHFLISLVNGACQFHEVSPLNAKKLENILKRQHATANEKTWKFPDLSHTVTLFDIIWQNDDYEVIH